MRQPIVVLELDEKNNLNVKYPAGNKPLAIYLLWKAMQLVDQTVETQIQAVNGLPAGLKL